MARRLVSIRRRVPPRSEEAYRRAWAEARAAVEATGSHAWAFASAHDASERMEFLEFADGADPRRDPAATAALRTLERDYGGEIEEWEEAG